MLSLIAVLRAVNFGGTGTLAMATLKAMCKADGFQAVRTHVASSNVVVRTRRGVAEVKVAFEASLRFHVGKPVGAVLRMAGEMAEVLARSPFSDAPGHRVTMIFLDCATSPATL